MGRGTCPILDLVPYVGWIVRLLLKLWPLLERRLIWFLGFRLDPDLDCTTLPLCFIADLDWFSLIWVFLKLRQRKHVVAALLTVYLQCTPKPPSRHITT
jgi:hypothetical protein